MKKTLFIILIFIVAACSSNSEKEMQTAARIYIDNIVIEERFGNVLPDSVKQMKNKVFAKYGINAEEYKKYFESLSSDKEKWDLFFKEAQKYLDTLKTIKKS